MPPRSLPPGGSSGGGGGGIVLAIVLLLLASAAGVGGWMYYQKQKHRPVAPVAPSPVSAPAPIAQVPPKEEPAPQPKVVAETPKPAPVVKPSEPKPEPKKMEPAPPSTPPPAPAPSADEARIAAIFEGTLNLDERHGVTPAAQAQAKAAMEAAIAHAKWADWAAMLRRSLHAAVKAAGPSSVTPQGLATLSRNPVFTTALEQSAFLATIPPTLGAKDPKQDPSEVSPGHAGEMKSFYRWLLSTPGALQSWLLTIRPGQDDAAKALEQWSQLAQGDPAAKEKYLNLALACAIVFEKPMKFRWNGSQEITVSADERYAYYTRHAAKGDLALNPDKLTARDLVWTVSAPVPESELEWALKKVNLRQKTWGSAYEAIVYDMERAVKDVNKYDEYTFAEIQKKGGICGDRSYFTAYTARAAGIPATILSGDGSRGPHAWITWLSADNQWDFAGRYGGYPLGNTRNPQTGQRESEQEFIRRTDRSASDAGLLQGLRPVWLAQAIEADQGVALAGMIFDGASALGDKVPAVWQAKLAFWTSHRGESPLEQWRAFLDVLKRAMKEDPNLLAEARAAEEKFVFPRQDTKLAMKELKKDVRKLDQADGKSAVDQADQIAKVIKQQAAVLLTSGPLDPIRSLYDKSYREHGQNPAVFKKLAADCWSFVKADAEVAKKACRDMESSFRRYIDSGGDYFDVTSQMSALNLIAGYYREIGETKRAESLAKDVEKSNARASRSAL